MKYLMHYTSADISCNKVQIINNSLFERCSCRGSGNLEHIRIRTLQLSGHWKSWKSLFSNVVSSKTLKNLKKIKIDIFLIFRAMTSFLSKVSISSKLDMSKLLLYDVFCTFWWFLYRAKACKSSLIWTTLENFEVRRTRTRGFSTSEKYNKQCFSLGNFCFFLIQTVENFPFSRTEFMSKGEVSECNQCNFSRLWREISANHFRQAGCALILPQFWVIAKSTEAQLSGMVRTVLIGCINETPNICCNFNHTCHVTRLQPFCQRDNHGSRKWHRPF